MGKKIKAQNKQKSYKTLPINKNKSFLVNLNNYLALLRLQLSENSVKEYIQAINKYRKKCEKSLRNYDINKIAECSLMITVCYKCKLLILNKKQEIECRNCQDYFHRRCFESCLGKYEQQNDQYVCNSCHIQQRKSQLSSESVTRTLNKEYQRISRNERCAHCQKNIKSIQTNEIYKSKCMRCERVFHKSCFGENPIICKICESQVHEIVEEESRKIAQKTKQLSIKESFNRARASLNFKKAKLSQKKSIKFLEDHSQSGQEKLDSITQPKPKEFMQESTRATTQQFKKGNFFKVPYPEMTLQQIQFYSKNLNEAIAIKNMSYTEELKTIDCDLENDVGQSFDFVYTELDFYDIAMYKKYKQQPIGPFLIKYTEKKGFDVVADMDLPKNMIVCQYLGDVYSYRSVLSLQENDSNMFLSKGKDADSTLYIVPKKYTNIARYINGVRPQDIKKVNVKSLKARIQGKPAIILYTIKKIRKGESLCYNYNAGQFKQGYDTSGFV